MRDDTPRSEAPPRAAPGAGPGPAGTSSRATALHRAVARLLSMSQRPARAVVYYDPFTGADLPLEPGERLAERYLRLPLPLSKAQWLKRFAPLATDPTFSGVANPPGKATSSEA